MARASANVTKWKHSKWLYVLNTLERHSLLALLLLFNSFLYIFLTLYYYFFSHTRSRNGCRCFLVCNACWWFNGVFSFTWNWWPGMDCWLRDTVNLKFREIDEKWKKNSWNSKNSHKNPFNRIIWSNDGWKWHISRWLLCYTGPSMPNGLDSDKRS